MLCLIINLCRVNMPCYFHSDNRKDTTLSSQRPRPSRFHPVYVLSRILTCIFYLFLWCLSVSVPLIDILSSDLYNLLSFLLKARPSPPIEPRQSAIIVLGADDGVGSNVTLRFSDLGFTVFALFPNKCESPSDQVQDDSTKTSEIASLLYAWHRMKERTGRQARNPPGIVIPITLDVEAHDQRMHAYETVHAYCTSHSLRLVALMVAPPGFRDNQAATRNVLLRDMFFRSRLYHSRPVFDLLSDSLSDIVAREITEPLLVARDYLTMLQEAQGRLLIISGCPSHSSIPGMVSTPFDNARLAVAQALRTELEPKGISVTIIVTAPLLPRAGPIEGASPSVTHLPSDMGFAQTLGLILSLFSIPEEELITAIQRVMMSRYAAQYSSTSVSIKDQ